MEIWGCNKMEIYRPGDLYSMCIQRKSMAKTMPCWRILRKILDGHFEDLKLFWSLERTRKRTSNIWNSKLSLSVENKESVSCWAVKSQICTLRETKGHVFLPGHRENSRQPYRVWVTPRKGQEISRQSGYMIRPRYTWLRKTELRRDGGSEENEHMILNHITKYWMSVWVSLSLSLSNQHCSLEP